MNAMKKFVVAGVAGMVLMVTAGTQMAAAAPWRGAYRGPVVGRPGYRTAFVHRPYYTAERFHRPAFFNRCW